MTAMKEEYAKHPRPDNLEVREVDVNEEVLEQIAHKMLKERDFHLRAIQAGVAQATVPLLRVIEGCAMRKKHAGFPLTCNDTRMKFKFFTSFSK